MTNIHFLTLAIYYKIFRCLYLRNEKYFLIFFHFINLDTIFSIFKKKMTLIAYVLLNLQTPKNVFG